MSTPGPRLRPTLAAIPAYVPGRAPAPRQDRPAYKLASNENPYPPLPSVLAVIEQAARSVNRYPDIFGAPVAEAVAARHGIGADQVVTGTGAVNVLAQLLQAAAGPGDEVVYAWRSFEAYPILVQLVGATGVPVPLREERHDLQAMLAAVTERTRVVLVCDPNNPTGTVADRQELTDFLDRVPSDVLVVLDEAYLEFARAATGGHGLELAVGRPNVCVLRTFSKAYGLAGLRVGYVVADAAVAGQLRKGATPFGVNLVAQAAAVASLAAEDELLARVEALVKERERVREALLGQGWAVPASESNFLWLRLGERTAEFAAACEEVGVTVRPFAGEGCRITVGETEANDLVLGVAARFGPAGS